MNDWQVVAACLRQAMRIQEQITCAVRDLDSPDEHVALRRFASSACRTRLHWTLERYVIPMLHDPSPVVRFAAHFVLSEELENEMVREARARS
jgi:3-methyladenine DNA glycosylase AlkC